MHPDLRRHAGIILLAVISGGVSILSLLIGGPDYHANPLRQELWRAGHAHARVLLLLFPDRPAAGRARHPHDVLTSPRP